MLRKWDSLPPQMQIPEVKEYYDLLSRRKAALFVKRMFDVTVSGLLLLFLLPFFVVISLAIRLDSPGPVFYRQVRVTTYGEHFRIFKFRSMVTGADKGSQLTVGNDSRVTKVGRFIRKYKLDEFSQLIDVFRGKMSFVGTRPEVPKYVERYTPEMMATLLMPAGITSQASVCYRDESELLDRAEDVEKTYLETVLPDKMRYNLAYIKEFSIMQDVRIMLMTLLAVFKSDDSEEENEKVKM